MQHARLGEQLRVGRIGAGIAALDIVDAELVEHADDGELVGQREIDAVGLRAVAQRGVEQIEPLAHDSHHQRLQYFSASATAAASTTYFSTM